MAAPKRTVVQPNIATLVYPALTGLALSGNIRVYAGQPGKFGTTAGNTISDGWPYQGNYDIIPVSVTLLGQVNALYFYHEQPEPVEVIIWMP